MKRTTTLFGILVALLTLSVVGCGDSQPQPPVADPATPTPPEVDTDPNVISLFDGKTMGQWKQSDFGGQETEVLIEDGCLVIKLGHDINGVTWQGEPPARMNYEIELEAKRIEGIDFFCGLTFPVNKSSCSLIVGGWAGSVVGISCLDYMDAANNETTEVMTFDDNQWYHIRVRVTEGKLEAWIDEKEVVNVPTKDRHISVRPEVDASVPLGIATWQTGGAARNIRMILLTDEEVKRISEEDI